MTLPSPILFEKRLRSSDRALPLFTRGHGHIEIQFGEPIMFRHSTDYQEAANEIDMAVRWL